MIIFCYRDTFVSSFRLLPFTSFSFATYLRESCDDWRVLSALSCYSACIS